MFEIQNKDWKREKEVDIFRIKLNYKEKLKALNPKKISLMK